MTDSFSPPRQVAEDLNRAAVALENMQASGELAPSIAVTAETGSPSIPPAMFGAGGPMWVSWLGVCRAITD